MRGRKPQELTTKQTRLLLFLYHFRQQYGESPSMVMIVKGLGLSSNRSVIDMIKLLVERGYLIAASKVSRSTQLTDKAYARLNLGKIPQDIGNQPPLYKRPAPEFEVHSSKPHGWSASPQPSWKNTAPQPSGSTAGVDNSILKLFNNTLSLLASYAGTYSPPVPVSYRLPKAVLLTAILAVGIYLIFGSGIEATLLYGLLIVIIIKRSLS